MNQGVVTLLISALGIGCYTLFRSVVHKSILAMVLNLSELVERSMSEMNCHRERSTVDIALDHSFSETSLSRPSGSISYGSYHRAIFCRVSQKKEAASFQPVRLF